MDMVRLVTVQILYSFHGNLFFILGTCKTNFEWELFGKFTYILWGSSFIRN